MDAVVKKQPSAQARNFIENVLGFGVPFDTNNISSLFKRKEGSLHYAKNNSESQASINTVDRSAWDKLFVNEAGSVIYNLESNAHARIEAFVDRSLMAENHRLVESITSKRHSDFLTMFSTAVTEFFDKYRREIDPGAELVTCATLRRLQGSLDFRLLVRMFLESEHETIFICVDIPSVVKVAALNIHPEQIKHVEETTRQFISGFGNVSQLFLPLGEQFDITKFIIQHAFTGNVPTSDAARSVFESYRKAVITNKELFNGAAMDPDPMQYELFEHVVSVTDITSHPQHECLILRAMELAGASISTHLYLNACQAIEANKTI